VIVIPAHDRRRWKEATQEGGRRGREEVGFGGTGRKMKRKKVFILPVLQGKMEKERLEYYTACEERGREKRKEKNQLEHRKKSFLRRGGGKGVANFSILFSEREFGMTRRKKRAKGSKRKRGGKENAFPSEASLSAGKKKGVLSMSSMGGEKGEAHL